MQHALVKLSDVINAKFSMHCLPIDKARCVVSLARLINLYVRFGYVRPPIVDCSHINFKHVGMYSYLFKLMYYLPSYSLFPELYFTYLMLWSIQY